MRELNFKGQIVSNIIPLGHFGWQVFKTRLSFTLYYYKLNSPVTLCALKLYLVA